MAITHPTTVRNALANSIDDQVNQGSTYGKLKILTSGDTVLATVTLQDPAFGAANTGVITLAGVPLSDTSADATGTAAKFTVTDSDDTIIFTGSAGLTGASPDLVLDNTSFVAGQTFTITALTYTAPA